MATTTTTRPKLPHLKTPLTSTFPTELPSALSARTPISAFPEWRLKGEEGLRTPITPPVAYMDFLKSVASPTVSELPMSRESSKDEGSSSTGSSPTVTPMSEDGRGRSVRTTPASTPSTTGSERCSCSSTSTSSALASIKSPPFTTTTTSSFNYPLSAPPRDRRMHLRIPPSASFLPSSSISSSHGNSITSPLSITTPMSANPLTASTLPSAGPFSASLISPVSARGTGGRRAFDWDAALLSSGAKSARFAPKESSFSGERDKGKGKERSLEVSGEMSKRCGVRHVREVVTHTCTRTTRTRTVAVECSTAGDGADREGTAMGGGMARKEVRMREVPRGKRRRLVRGDVVREMERAKGEAGEE